MQRITIKNFGPIKEIIDMPINDFMVFIGPQASGKSTIAKLVYFFRSLPEQMLSYAYNRTMVKDIIESSTKYFPYNSLFEEFVDLHFVRMFNHSDYINCELFYKYNNLSLKIIVNKHSHLRVEVSDDEIYYDFNQLLNTTLTKEVKIYDAQKLALIELQQKVIDISDKYFIKKTSKSIFIPSGRSLFSSISNQVFNINTEKLDFFIKEFFNQLYFFKDSDNPLSKATSSLTEIAKKLSIKVLKGEYFYDNNLKETIKIQDNKHILLPDASSGQQEAIWIIEYIKHYLALNTSNFTIFEEPEAHLYPEAQKHITELIALLANSADNQVIITTHSPYILSAVNNLMYAHRIGQLHPEQVSQKIDKNLWLDYKRVSAYFVENGTIRNILDDELQSIAVEEIDNASRLINQEYDFLLNLEYHGMPQT